MLADSGTVMEGTEGAFGSGVVLWRACTMPSYLALEPFNQDHASVPGHRQPGYPLRTEESGNTITITIALSPPSPVVIDSLLVSLLELLVLLLLLLLLLMLL